jgi:hypothetical protein
VSVSAVAELAPLRASERTAVRGRVLELPAPLDGLFPEGGPRRGTVVVVQGSTSLLLRLAAAATPARSWCAAVGFPALGVAAAAEQGIDLRRFAVVRVPDAQWATGVAALLDGIDVLLVRPPARGTAVEARRLAARVRERGTVVLAAGWPDSAELRISITGDTWQGLGAGWGRLQGRQLEVAASGRGAAARERRVSLWLPSAS